MRRGRLSELTDAVTLSRGWRRAVIAVAAGAASALALAPFHLFPVLFVTLPIFVLLLDGGARAPEAGWRHRLIAGFAVGWFFGFGYFLGGLWWIGAAFFAEAGAGLIALMPLAVVALPAGLALFWGAAAALARLFWSQGWRRVIVLAALLSLAEWLRGHVLTGFPWNAFGYTLMPVPAMMQGAALVGLWGMTFAAFLVFAAPVMLIGGRIRMGERIAVGIALLLFAANLGYGLVRLAFAEDTDVPGVALRLVQPMLAQDEKWTTTRDADVLRHYLALTGKGLVEGKPPPFTIAIWPETALPFFLEERPDALAAIGALLPRGGSLITGAARAEQASEPGQPDRIFNSIFVIDDNGFIRDAYDKVHLVPFGEYLPFAGFFSRLGLHQMIALPGGFDAGPRLRSLALAGAPVFGPLICYEIVFPHAVVDAQQRPAWLLNVTNDGWFGDTPGPRQHFQQAVVRAVEEGLPLARAANTGISAIVDPYGRVRVYLPVGALGVVDGPLPAALPPTLYGRLGDMMFFIALALALAIAGIVSVLPTFTPAKTCD